MFKLKHLIFLAVICMLVGGVSLAKGATCSPAASFSNTCGAGGACDSDEICTCGALGQSCLCGQTPSCVQNSGNQTVNTPVNSNNQTTPTTSTVGNFCLYYGGGCGTDGCAATELCTCGAPSQPCTCKQNPDCAQNPGDKTVGTPVNPNNPTTPKTGSCISCSSVGSSCSYYGESGVCNNTYGTYCGPGDSYNCIKACCVKKNGVYDYESGNKVKKSAVDFLYNGPMITDISSVLVPVGKMLYYGGLFIGIAFIVIAGYTLMTSEGNPQRTQEGQEQLTAAILGIIFILLSAAILRVIINSIIGLNVSI